MGKREKIGKCFVERDSKGRFKDWSRIGRSINQDKKRIAKKLVKSGYGNRGDLRRGPNYTDFEDDFLEDF